MQLRGLLLSKYSRLQLCSIVVYSSRHFVLWFAWCCFVLVFFGPLSIAMPRLGKRELILVLFLRLLDLRLFGFVCFLFLCVSGQGCGCDCGTSWTFLLPFCKISISIGKCGFDKTTYDIFLPLNIHRSLSFF